MSNGIKRIFNLQPLREVGLNKFRELLGSSDFGGCFCAVWTSHGEDWTQRCEDKSQPNFFITKKNVEDGRHVGFLIYDGEELVGWTGSGPKKAFPWLKEKLGSRLSDFSDQIWSVGCLAIKKNFRGNGIADSVVQAVIAEARASGATCVEAYPARPFHEPRVFRGTYNLYNRLGFAEVDAERDGEHEIVLMRHPLTV